MNDEQRKRATRLLDEWKKHGEQLSPGTLREIAPALQAAGMWRELRELVEDESFLQALARQDDAGDGGECVAEGKEEGAERDAPGLVLQTLWRAVCCIAEHARVDMTLEKLAMIRGYVETDAGELRSIWGDVPAAMLEVARAVAWGPLRCKYGTGARYCGLSLLGVGRPGDFNELPDAWPDQPWQASKAGRAMLEHARRLAGEGKRAQAREELAKAFRLAHDTKSFGTSDEQTLGLVACVCAELGETAMALDTVNAIESDGLKLDALRAVAWIFSRSGKHRLALEVLEDAVAVAERISNDFDLAWTSGGDIAMFEVAMDFARENEWMRAWQLARRMHNPKLRTLMMLKIVKRFRWKREWALAEKVLKDAHALAKRQTVVECTDALAWIVEAFDDFDAMREALQDALLAAVRSPFGRTLPRKRNNQ